jgi:hypothetical protein
MGTAVCSCSHSSPSNFFVYDPRLRLLWLAESAMRLASVTHFAHFAAFHLPAMSFTTLHSGYPFGIPFGLPSRMKCFQDIGA